MNESEIKTWKGIITKNIKCGEKWILTMDENEKQKKTTNLDFSTE